MQCRKQLDILRKSSQTKIGILVGLPLLASLGSISLHCYRVHNFCFYHLFALIVNDDVPMKIEHNSPEPLAFCSIQSAKWDDDRRVYGGITNKGGWREPKFSQQKFGSSLDRLLTPRFCHAALPHTFDPTLSKFIIGWYCVRRKQTFHQIRRERYGTAFWLLYFWLLKGRSPLEMFWGANSLRSGTSCLERRGVGN